MPPLQNYVTQLWCSKIVVWQTEYLRKRRVVEYGFGLIIWFSHFLGRINKCHFTGRGSRSREEFSGNDEEKKVVGFRITFVRIAATMWTAGLICFIYFCLGLGHFEMQFAVGRFWVNKLHTPRAFNKNKICLLDSFGTFISLYLFNKLHKSLKPNFIKRNVQWPICKLDIDFNTSNMLMYTNPITMANTRILHRNSFILQLLSNLLHSCVNKNFPTFPGTLFHIAALNLMPPRQCLNC